MNTCLPEGNEAFLFVKPDGPWVFFPYSQPHIRCLRLLGQLYGLVIESLSNLLTMVGLQHGYALNFQRIGCL
nr:hypothetical protein [Hymenobacter sediminis]